MATSSNARKSDNQTSYQDQRSPCPKLQVSQASRKPVATEQYRRMDDWLAAGDACFVKPLDQIPSQ